MAALGMRAHRSDRHRVRQERLWLGQGGGFAWIALWQLLVFLLLLLLVWVDELLDLAALLFDVPPREPNLVRGCLASAGVLLGAVVLVGNTYLQQRRIVRGLLTICSYCKKIRLATESWQRIEEYIGRRSAIQFTHSVCPQCLDRETQRLHESAPEEVSPQTGHNRGAQSGQRP